MGLEVERFEAAMSIIAVLVDELHEVMVVGVSKEREYRDMPDCQAQLKER